MYRVRGCKKRNSLDHSNVRQYIIGKSHGIFLILNIHRLDIKNDVL